MKIGFKISLPKWLLAMADNVPVERVDNSGGVLSEANAKRVWTTKDGRKLPIGQMTEMHAKNALAVIVKHVIDENAVAYKGTDGMMQFAQRLDHLIDGSTAFINDAQSVVSFEAIDNQKVPFSIDHATQTITFKRTP